VLFHDDFHLFSAIIDIHQNCIIFGLAAQKINHKARIFICASPIFVFLTTAAARSADLIPIQKAASKECE
jgi:hypothetical protein